MNDLEHDLREMFRRREGDVREPSPDDVAPVVRRSRRRQGAIVTASAVGVVLVAAASFAAIRAVGSGEGGTPAVAPTVTTTINSVSITHPEEWFVFDPEVLVPDEVLVPPGDPSQPLPRLVLAVSPREPDELFACPGMIETAAPTFLMTVQERPLALSGGAAAAWPVALEPLPIAQAGGDPVGSGDSGCYPDWEFLHAGWTAAGRTFEAIVGFAPDATEEEREAVAAAFASMTFEPAAEPAKSAVIATGTAGGETWELTAERQGGALSLSLNAESGGSGGGSEPGSSELFLLSHLLGEGEEAQLVVFGAVPVGSTQVKARDGDAEVVYRVLDVPDTIDAELDAFVFTTSPEAELQVIALDKSGEVLAMGEVGPARDPAEAPVPTVVDVEPEHGGVVWGLYLALGDSLDDPAMDAARQRATELGYHPGGGELACDDGAAEALGVDASYSVAVYFRTREDAEAAAALFGSAPVGIARVTTYCLD